MQFKPDCEIAQHSNTKHKFHVTLKQAGSDVAREQNIPFYAQLAAF